MMRIISSFMIFLIVIQTQSISILQTAYQINTAYFISKCENKAKPQLKCNGKCHLSKSISKLATPVSETKNPVFVFSFEYLKSITYVINLKVKTKAKSFPNYISKKIQSLLFEILVPPKV